MNDSDYPDDLIAFVGNLPTQPGVYRMLDDKGTVLYVGKAGNLRKRVTSYFTKTGTGAKTRSLVGQIASIDVSITRSETEALLLESTLIKSLSPKYNVLLRDDKSYPYIYVNTEHEFPVMGIIRSKKKPKKGMCFGPFPSATAVRETLNIIQKIFRIRNCSDSYFSARTRPCLQYQIKRCTAPCTAYISAEDYQKSVNDAIRFLQGKSQLILEDLEKRMEDAVVRLAFEEAALLRDQIKSLRMVQERQGVVQGEGDADVIAMDVRPGFACVQCVSVRDGQVIDSTSFFPQVPKLALDDDDDLRQQVFDAFIAFYYLERPERIPSVLIVDERLPELSLTSELLTQLRGKKCHVQISPRGSRKRWVDFARNNLQLAIAENTASEATNLKRYQALTDLLQLSHPVSRMECFDISHTQGKETIASCVVFGSEGPIKRDYRYFNISGITPGDDYAAMEQALTRRYKKLMLENKTLPDILIVDGGKGQFGVARRVLTSLGLEGITLLGIAKGPDRKAGFERLILESRKKSGNFYRQTLSENSLAEPPAVPYESMSENYELDEMTMPTDSPALHLLQYIRDEAHRFAITAHRKKRLKVGLESSLEAIEGVGPKRRRALLQRFGGLRELSKAPVDEISRVNGISEHLALRIYNHFHS